MTRKASFFGFGQSADIDIILHGSDTRKMAEMKTEDGKKERHYLYYDGESVSGKVNVTLKKPGQKLEHNGIKIEFVGQIELFYDRLSILLVPLTDYGRVDAKQLLPFTVISCQLMDLEDLLQKIPIYPFKIMCSSRWSL